MRDVTHLLWYDPELPTRRIDPSEFEVPHWDMHDPICIAKIKDMYVKKTSLTSITNLTGISQPVIKRILQDEGIHIRTRAEAKEITYGH